MVFLLRICAHLPLFALHVLGGIAGVLALPLRRRSADLRENLAQAGLPGTRMALRAAWEMGKGVAELPAIWLRPYPGVLGLVREVRGWEHVEAARAQGRGLLMLAPHLGCWELIGLYLATHMPFLALYRPPRQDWADRLMRRGREQGRTRLATPDMRGVKAMLAALKQGEAVGLLPDQVASKGEGVWAAFFGRPALTPTLAFRLLASTGAVPLLCFCERLSWGRGYRLWFEPMPPPPKDPARAARQLNQQLEQLILRHPEQYLWSYRRYKAPRRMPPPRLEDLP